MDTTLHKTEIIPVGGCFQSFRAICDCGWKGPTNPIYSLCDYDAEEHIQELQQPTTEGEA